MRPVLFVFILLGVSASASAQHLIQASEVKTAPKIDGRVIEPVWQEATLIDKMYQRQPDTGQPMTEHTEFFICHDTDNFYIAFKCYDSEPEKITAKELARDASLSVDDKVQIIIDTYWDQRNGYWFQINPRGCIGDALVSQNGAAFNKSWDGLWEGTAHITDWGWEGEVAIPFKTMSFRYGQTTWGLKLIRQVTHKNELGYWPVANLDTYKFQVSDAGLLEGMQNMSQGIGLDVVPYALVGTDKSQTSDREFPSDLGFDAFYQITSGLKSAFTVNTDFAQTEVDDRRVNLTRFPLFYEEKRDFFLDGSNYFNFGLDGDRDHPYTKQLIPFFSRRLGLDATGNPVPIRGGIKLTGQAGQWSMGFLDIIDERQTKNQNFAAGRITRNFGDQSYIGAIGTMGNSFSTLGNSLAGLDLKLGTSKFAGNKNLSLLLFGLLSNTEGKAGRDAAYGASFSYPNDLLHIVAGYHEIGENFNAGIGFVPRKGIRQSYFRAAMGPRPKGWNILQSVTALDVNYITDLRNELETRAIRFTPFEIEFISGDQISTAFEHNYEQLDAPFSIHPEHTISAGNYTFKRYEVEAISAKRRPLWLSAEYEWGEFYTGRLSQWMTGLGYKIAVPLFLGVEYEHNNVSLDTGDFTTDVARLNVNLLFSPKMFMYNYIQYDNLSDRMGWQSRFVWILKPGREIFFVWNSISENPTLERFAFTETSSRLKFKYAIRF